MGVWTNACKLGLAVFLGAACGAPAWSQGKECKLESCLEGAKFWDATADDFIDREKAPLFKWTSEQTKTTARYPGYTDSPTMTFMGQKVWECLANFKDGKLESVTAFLYTRGDSGDMTKDQFDDAVEAACKSVQDWAGGAKFADEEKRVVNANNIYYKLWQKEPHSAVLNWSCSGKNAKAYRPEYIKLTLHRHNADRKFLENLAGATDKDFKPSSEVKGAGTELTRNVVKEDNGDVFIKDVPMVDQGAKGYCAVAATERVLKYYGENVDQHMLGQLASSSADGGTNPSLLLKSIRKAGASLGVKVRELYVDKDWDDISDILKNMAAYNREAKKKNAAQIKRSDICVVNGNVTTYYPDKLFMMMDPEVFVNMRCNRDKAAYRKFVDNIKEFTNKGVPIAWALTLGKVKEDNAPQGMGGHLRLIIGYNEKENKVIYTDSWGAGHEFKKMGMDEAWTVTVSSFIYIPKKAKGVF